MGGYVAWEAGTRADGLDSKAFEVAPVSHWPDMLALILVVSAAKKDVPSTAGMQATVATSTLFQTRAKETVPKRMLEMQEAVQKRDFEAFARITMMDSNSFHATCADTYPPIYYMNDVSRAAVRFVEAVNEKAGRLVCAYTFDAGPNAVVYYEESDADYVEQEFAAVLGHVHGWGVEGGNASQYSAADERVTKLLVEGVSRVIMTRVGEGPISIQHHLIDEQGELAR